MGKQAIVERILSDANAEAQAIITEAEEKAAAIIADAQTKAQREKLGTEAIVAEKSKAILDGKAATARLDSAKILLAEKRRVLDAVYQKALEQLVKLGQKETLKLAETLLCAYAEQGDEIVFADNFAYKAQVGVLSVIKEKGLKVSHKTADIGGGFILIGKNSDKDLSYGALLAIDREEHQAQIAAKIFKD